MPAGIQVFNTSGYFQITDLLKNFVLLSKGSVNLDGAPGWQPNGSGNNVLGCHAQVSFPNTNGYPPVVAFRCDTKIVVYRTRLISGNWVMDLVSENGYTLTNTIYWYAFGPPPNSSPTNYGFEVRTSAGQIAYHTGYLPMRVVDLQTLAGGSSGNFSAASGRTIAIVICASKWEWTAQVPAGAWQQFLSSTCLITSAANTGTVQQVTYGSMINSVNFGFGAGGSGSWVAMAVDVTNY